MLPQRFGQRIGEQAARGIAAVAGRMADSFTFGEGLAKEARLPAGHLWKGLPIKLEAEFIIREKLAPTLQAAGTSLANVVRIQQFHADLREFYPAYQVWQQHLPGQHLPYSVVEVPFLPVPGCTVQFDLWVYAP